MKRIFSNNRIVVLAFFTVFSIAAAPALANGDSKDLPVELKYSGHVNNQPMYKLVVAGNTEQDEFTIIIRDEDKNTLYRENIKGENFSKSFVLNTNEIGDDKIHFEIISKKTKKSVVYELSRNTRVEEQIVVTEVK